MDVEIRFFHECPNWTLAVKRVHEALKRARLAGVDIRLNEVALLSEPSPCGSSDPRRS